MIDATRRKKIYIIIPGIGTVVASGIILLSQNFWLVATSQVATALFGAAIVPAVTGITLGMVHQAGFNRQNGHNQVSNHAGNLVGAALSGFLGWHFGLPAVFWLAAAFGVLTIVSVLMIPSGAIDDDEARGLSKGENENEKSEIAGFRAMFRHKTLLIVAAALGCFHLGNGGMLPLYGLAVASTKQVDPSRLVATAIIVAQSVMIVVSLIATHVGEREGYWRLLLISFVALPIRGVIAAFMINHSGVYPVEILDGIAAGLQTVVVPGLVARVLHRSGRINAGQGAVMTIQGLGGALSPLIGGWLAQEIGYAATFMNLGGFALGSIALWLGFAADLKPACEKWGSSAHRGARTAMAAG